MNDLTISDEADLPRWPTSEREEARKAIAAMLTKCTQLFSKFTDEMAQISQPMFQHALIGDGDEPRFCAEDIAQGFIAWHSKHKHRSPPMPAEIVEAIEGPESESRVAHDGEFCDATLQALAGKGWSEHRIAKATKVPLDRIRRVI